MPSLDVASIGYVAGGGLTALNTTTGFTVSFWHRSTVGGIPAAQDILRQNLTTNASRSGYFVQLTALGALQLKIQSATAEVINVVTANTVGRRGQWTHYAGTYNPTGTLCFGYINGVYSARVASAGTIAQPATTQTTFLGNENQGQVPSQIFDFQLHPGTVLGPQDIPLLMRPDRRLPSLRARWCGLGFTGLDNGQVLQDESGNGNNMTVSNTIQIGPEPPWRATLA